MGRTCLLSGMVSIILPLFLFFAGNYFHSLENRECYISHRLILGAYVFVILYFTVFRMHHSDPPYLMLTPLWSYAKFDQADIRWQVYMNVFLFIPFGFMFPWCSERFQKIWKVLLISAAFSALTEIIQYVLRIGLCETDDVIHNTLGGALGYGYWRLLSRIQARFRGENK